MFGFLEICEFYYLYDSQVSVIFGSVLCELTGVTDRYFSVKQPYRNKISLNVPN